MSQGHSDYMKLMGELRDPLPDDVRTKDLDFREGKGKEGNATIFFKAGKPLMVAWYEWDLDDEYFLQRLAEELGKPVKLVSIQGGNGHYRAALEIQE